MKAKALNLGEANDFVEMYHRHHKPVHRDKFRCGVIDDNNKLRGVVQIARPVSRHLDDGQTVEVVRLCTDGYKGACSFLYARAARAAAALGYGKIITYILASESGASLRAAGWTCEGVAGGGGVGTAKADQDRPMRRRSVSSGGQKHYK